VLIVMAGLPGTGKSTLAARLAEELRGVVLCKDRVRTALFPPPVLDYSTGQDDLCMAAIYDAAECILLSPARRPVILDGRTFSRAEQVRELQARAAALGERPFVIECVCDDDVARGRLEADLARGGHPAANRTCELYQSLKDRAEPLEVPRLVLDTGTMPLEECVRQCLRHLDLGRPNDR
jgi:predicted kinase